MASTTLNTYSLTGTEREKGFFARLGARLVNARMREANRVVNAYLLSLDDETLARLGYERGEIAARNPGRYPFL